MLSSYYILYLYQPEKKVHLELQLFIFALPNLSIWCFEVSDRRSVGIHEGSLEICDSLVVVSVSVVFVWVASLVCSQRKVDE